MAPGKYMYCPHSGRELEEAIIEQHLRERCPECERVFYVNPLPVVSCLLDAETAVSSHYGNMVIIAYEVEYISGEIKAGDDARDVRFFPMNDLPELAFKANLTAVRKYQESCGSLD